jgi:hypothetical protein
MATGRDIQLTQHRGEYLVAAELCRLGYLATTFTGNVPDIDIIAVNDKLQARPLQVKAIKTGSWQFNARKFFDVDCDKETGNQEISKRRLEYPDLKFVLVDLGEQPVPDFYILDMKRLRDMIFKRYKKNLEKQGGRRPNAPDSTHTIVTREMIKRYKDNWDCIFD